MHSVNVSLLLVSTERDKDFPHVEVTESAPAEVVDTHVSWELLLPGKTKETLPRYSLL